MRRLWEAMVNIAFESGKFHYDTIDKYKFREFIKRDYGEGYSCIWYIDNAYRRVECENAWEIPRYAVLDFMDGNTNRLGGSIMSSTLYTKKQFSRMIDNTINAMHENKVTTPKFFDIIEEINRYRDGKY